MNCPDTNRLIDLLGDSDRDLELRAHLQHCRTCRAELRLIRQVRAAFTPQLQVPEYLIQRAVTRLAEPVVLRREGRVRHIATAAALGTVTTALTVLGTGAADAGGPTGFLLFSVAAGGLVAIHEASILRAE